MPRKNPIPAPPSLDTAVNPDVPLLDTREEPVIEVVSGEVEDEPVPIRALATSAADHHLVVGMATLANLSEDEFRSRLDTMKRGMARVETIQREMMEQGVDYGRVPNVPKPFLHQPGAEKLANVYGFAVRQEAERITRKADDDPESPPYAYHVKSYVHLGDTSGPVVAESHGEANPYEDRYHFRFSKPACPTCGKTDTIIRRKTPPQLEGKLQCAAFGNKGGCGSLFEPNDPRLGSRGKEMVPDSELYGLAETLVQMAAKRSFVAGVRRATGTSGLFSQDDDSPAVLAQSGESDMDPDRQPPVVETATIDTPVAPGGKTTQATQVQHDRLRVLAKEKGLGGAKIAELLNRLFGLTVEPTGKAASDAVKTLDADAFGNLLAFIEFGDTSSVGKASA